MSKVKVKAPNKVRVRIKAGDEFKVFNHGQELKYEDFMEPYGNIFVIEEAVEPVVTEPVDFQLGKEQAAEEKVEEPIVEETVDTSAEEVEEPVAEKPVVEKVEKPTSKKKRGGRSSKK